MALISVDRIFSDFKEPHSKDVDKVSWYGFSYISFTEVNASAPLICVATLAA